MGVKQFFVTSMHIRELILPTVRDSMEFHLFSGALLFDTAGRFLVLSSTIFQGNLKTVRAPDVCVMYFRTFVQLLQLVV